MSCDIEHLPSEFVRFHLISDFVVDGNGFPAACWRLFGYRERGAPTLIHTFYDVTDAIKAKEAWELTLCAGSTQNTDPSTSGDS